MDNTLNSSYGADLKLFYVEDYQSLTSLSSVGIASQNAYASLETTTFGYSRTGNIITGYTYDLTYERGTLIYGSDGRPTGIDPSALYENSLTIALNLEDYADTINAIIATTPVPEPAETAFLAALLSITAITVVKRKR